MLHKPTPARQLEARPLGHAVPEVFALFGRKQFEELCRRAQLRRQFLRQRLGAGILFDNFALALGQIKLARNQGGRSQKFTYVPNLCDPARQLGLLFLDCSKDVACCILSRCQFAFSCLGVSLPRYSRSR
jgi:hypothetical protein